MIFFFVLAASFILTYLIKNYALKKSFLAEVDERSSHVAPTPHGGGVAIAITWFLGLIYVYVFHNLEEKLFFALLVGLVLSVVSFLDDLFELNPKIRLLVQAMVALSGLFLLGGFQKLNLFFIVIDNMLITNIFAFLLIVWFINLYNFLDGIDGYAGSEAIFLGISGFIIFGGEHFFILIASVAGFLLWNWDKAKIFMGDVGSTLLGYNFAVFTIYYANEQSSNPWVWIILFGLFWFDATFTLLRRFLNKEKLSQAHKKHAYQRLYQSGWRHSRVVIASIFVNCILFGIGYFISNLFLAFLISLIVLYTCVKFVDREKAFN